MQYAFSDPNTGKRSWTPPTGWKPFTPESTPAGKFGPIGIGASHFGRPATIGNPQQRMPYPAPIGSGNYAPIPPMPFRRPMLSRPPFQSGPFSGSPYASPMGNQSMEMPMPDMTPGMYGQSPFGMGRPPLRFDAPYQFNPSPERRLQGGGFGVKLNPIWQNKLPPPPML